ncbi:hypothetical protein U3A58_19825 [Algoriphagus sp. C2-6-M1]|uniref:hypothetical protein n=1 Tax=Algoriphagus persicinus TaxID=3108754 RepID=UPI002B3BC6AF|nr:hypothetical protein [Algoriphagus sp. C2-6-M1]MEB2782647.1 hypothetical protein [Algoriphagus sp. C2-6-M1]
MTTPLRFPTYTSISESPVTFCENLSPEVFQYPFFNQGVTTLRKPHAERESSILEDHLDLSESQLLPIKGFIFHTSHCGSTLLGRMLGSSSQVRMVSEPESINGLLLSFLLHQLPEDQVLAHLKRVIDAYRIPGDGKKFVLFKLTSWNVFLNQLFQKSYSKTPWIYIDRETEELVQILTTEDGGFIDWWHHPVDILRKHFVTSPTASLTLECYLRSIILGHREHALTAKNRNGIYMNYPEFLHQFSQILAHFQLAFTSDEMEKALEFRRFESKKFEPILFQSSD